MATPTHEVDPLIGQTFYFTAKPQVEDAPRGGNGSQVLPVAELSPDFDGVPEDGMEYLFLVRREAATHAKVYRASMNPYEEVTSGEGRVVKEKNHFSKPSEEWRNAFVEKFKQTRIRMATAPRNGTLQLVESETIPAPKQESAWRIFINGKRSKPVKPQPQTRSSLTISNPAVSTTSSSAASIATSGTTLEDTDMTDLESAKAAILASLELDTPEELLSPPPSLPDPSARTLTDHAAPLGGEIGSSNPPVEEPQSQLPEYVQLPQLPSPCLLLSIPSTSIIHVLSHFNEWYVERIDKYQEVANWVPSTIFAPPALRKKPTLVKKRGPGGAGGLATTTSKIPLTTAAANTPTLVAAKKGQAPNVAPLPSPHEIHWILSLLSRLNDLLDGDDLSNLRLLGKTIVEMIELSEKDEIARNGRVGSSDPPLSERRSEVQEGQESRARGWMVLAAISGIWKQEDLWNVNL